MKTKKLGKIGKRIKESNWTKGQYHDGHGKFCLVGWVRECYSYKDSLQASEIYDKIKLAIEKLYPRKSTNILNFNDARRTTFNQVKKVIEEAGV